MTERDFAYWLRGYFELVQPTSIDEEQTKMIKEHLDKVFNRFPTYNDIGDTVIYTAPYVSC